MKHFTLEEARRALADVRPIVARIVVARGELTRLQADLGRVRRTVSGNGGGMDADKVAALEESARASAETVARCVAEIEQLGAQVKDLELGLVDFPARHPETGETVLLCWRDGEDDIGFWHGLEEGFAGRKPLPF